MTTVRCHPHPPPSDRRKLPAACCENFLYCYREVQTRALAPDYDRYMSDEDFDHGKTCGAMPSVEHESEYGRATIELIKESDRHRADPSSVLPAILTLFVAAVNGVLLPARWGEIWDNPALAVIVIGGWAVGLILAYIAGY